MGENINKFDGFPAICQCFSYKIFHLVSYLPLMNLWCSGFTQNKNISGQWGTFFRKSKYAKLAYCCILYIFINMITELIVNECSIIPAHVETNQCKCRYVLSHALHYVCTYTAATQQGVADICLYQLQCTSKCMCLAYRY